MRHILLASALVAAGATRAAADPPDPEPDLDALRSLPYVSSSPVAEDRSGVLLHDPARTQPGLRLYTVKPLGRAELIDAGGRVVHAWGDAGEGHWRRAELLEDGGLLVVGADPAFGPDSARAPDGAPWLARLDRDSRVVWKRDVTAHHDVEIRPDGKVAALGFERRRVPAVHPDVDTKVDGILTLDPDTGEPLDFWGFLDAIAGREDVFALGDAPVTRTGGEPWVDLFHANSLEWMAHDPLFETHPLYSPDHVLVCFRHQDRVAIFDARERRVVWAWGAGEISGPHDAQLTPEGNVLLFDNGQSRSRSRAMEVDPRTDRVVWEWQADPPESFYTAARGSVQRLPNGNVLMAESDNGGALEVAPDGTPVWEWVNPHRRGRDRPLVIIRMKWVGSGEEYGFSAER
jgi:hypothetical protein